MISLLGMLADVRVLSPKMKLNSWLILVLSNTLKILKDIRFTLGTFASVDFWVSCKIFFK